VCFIDSRDEFTFDYVALPIGLRDESSERRIQTPSAEQFGLLFAQDRAILEILGPGWIGKTTLASQIGHLARAAGQPDAFSRCMLPIWVDEETKNLWEVVQRKVNSWFSEGEKIEEEILKRRCYESDF
jgi:hypothetical protein